MRLLAVKHLLDISVLTGMQMNRGSGSLAHWAPMLYPSSDLVYSSGMFCSEYPGGWEVLWIASSLWTLSLCLSQVETVREEMLRLKFKVEGEARKLRWNCRCEGRDLAKQKAQGSKMISIGLFKLLLSFPFPMSSRPSLPFFLPFFLLPKFSQTLTTSCEICFAWILKETVLSAK